MFTLTLPAQSSLFVRSPGIFRLLVQSGNVEYRGKEVESSVEFLEESGEVGIDSRYGAHVELETSCEWFIMDNPWIKNLYNHSLGKIPRVQCIVAEESYLAETLKGYYERFEKSVSILDLQRSCELFTPLNTVGFVDGPKFLCKGNTEEKRLDLVWKAVTDQLDSSSRPVLINIGSFKSCNDAYARFRFFMKLFKVEHVLVSDDDRCFYTQYVQYPKFTWLGPAQRYQVSKPLVTVPSSVKFDLSNVKAVVNKSDYPPDSCLPLGEYVRLLKPVYLDSFESLKVGKLYGVCSEVELDPLVVALPITGIIKILGNFESCLWNGTVGEGEVYLVE